MQASLNTFRPSRIWYSPVLWIMPFLFISISSIAQPGQNCTNPLIINTLPYLTTDNTSGYQNDYAGIPGLTGCGVPLSFLSGNDVVYSYTAATDAYLNISMTPGQNFSGVFVYGACTDIGLSCLAAASGIFATPLLIENFQIASGESIYIVIAAASGSTSYTLQVTDQTGKSCESAIPVSSLPYSTNDISGNYGSNYSGSPGSTESCGTDDFYLAGDNIVYAYTASETVMIDISLLNFNNWTAIFVYDDCDNLGVTCAAIGDYGFFDTERRIDDLIVLQGETIYIMVTRGVAGSFGYTLDITEQLGFICESAIPVPSLPYTTSDNTNNYGIYYPGPPGDAASCGTDDDYLIGKNVVYAYTATEGNTLLDITLTNDNIWSSLFVYDDCGDIGLSCYTQGSFGISLTENVIEDLLVYHMQTIYIIVSSVGEMDYTLNITGSQGETCETALPIAAFPYTDTNNTADFGNAYAGSPGGNCGATENYLDGNNVVYRYIPTSDNLIHISLDSPDPGAAIFVYNSCVNIGLNCDAGDFGTDAGERLIENFIAQGGSAVNIMVSNLSGTMDYTLTVTEEQPCAPGTDTEGLFVGMPCVNPGFINTMISEDCTCTGDVAPPPPANNTIENAHVLALNAPGNCPLNSVSGSNINAWPSYPGIYCDDEYPDVYYRFNSGNNTSVNLTFINGTIISKTISIGILGEAPGSCAYSWVNYFQTVAVLPFTDYAIRIGSFESADPPGTFLICVSAANPDIFECPILLADIGDPCDDGFESTVNDVVQESCNCVGEMNTAPANNFLNTAQILTLNPIGGCPAGSSPGDLSLATAEYSGTNCEPDSPDVYYRFNSGDNSTVYVSVLRGSIENMVVSIAPVNITPTCSYNFLDYFNTQAVIPNTEYIIRVATFSTISTGGSFTICVSAENPGTSLSGNVDWNADCGSTTATVKLYEPGTSILVEEYDTTVDAYGHFSVPNAASGTYDVFVKVYGALQKGVASVQLFSGPNQITIGELTKGDIDNNNAINIDDLTAFIGSFGLNSSDPGFNPMADLNCDASVNVDDLTAFISAFGVSGDSAPLD